MSPKLNRRAKTSKRLKIALDSIVFE